MIELEDLERALEAAQAVLEEHEIPVEAYLNFSPAARESLSRVATIAINVGLPRSRKELHKMLMRHQNLGMLLGVELARGKVSS